MFLALSFGREGKYSISSMSGGREFTGELKGSSWKGALALVINSGRTTASIAWGGFAVLSKLNSTGHWCCRYCRVEKSPGGPVFAIWASKSNNLSDGCKSAQTGDGLLIANIKSFQSSGQAALALTVMLLLRYSRVEVK